MTLVSTDAIVLHTQDYLESSRIVRLATRELGVQSVLARGARKSRSRFGHSLDLFAGGVAHFTLKPGRDLSNLSGFDLTRSRLALASDLDRFATASALAELALRFSHADSHDDAFDVLGSSLDDIAGAPAGASTDHGLAAAWQYVAALGFAPTIDRCCFCDSPVPMDSAALFSQQGGGVVCPRCARQTVGGRDLPIAARASIGAWLSGQPSALESSDERRAHLRLLREFLLHHLADGRTLRAFEGWEASLRRPV